MKTKHRRKRHLSFDPNHEFIAEAVDEYLKKGGKIEQLKSEPEKTNQATWFAIEDNSEADEFLNE
ncbi:hypothetical protein KJ966_03485 [bacterium]|nr:hypothetical protein [bacterium]